MQSQTLVLLPSLRLTDLGWDDNVFRVNKIDHPTGDFTATLSPGLSASLRLRRLQVSGQTDINFVYFKELSQIRSLDAQNGGHVELRLGRMKPFVGVEWASTRHRRNLEIDLPVRRVDSSWVGGLDFKISGKTSVGVMARRSRVDYTGETVYLDSDLAVYLGATATVQGVRLRYSLTPLTTVGADLDLDRVDFPQTAERNSHGFRMMSVVSFQPLAVVNGSAQVGIRRREFVDGDVPPFQGAVARFDLGYTLLGRTRFALDGHRDLSYSYRPDQRDYLETGIGLTVTQRLSNSWDVQGTFGWFSLLYGLSDAGGTSLAEKGRTYAFGAGYHIEKTRVGFDVSRQTRTSDFSVNRGYEGTQIASSVRYGF